MKRNVFVLAILVLLGTAAVVLAISNSTPVNAQSEGEVWNSSAEAPDDFLGEGFSPPDGSMVPQEDDAMNGGGLVSWRVTGSALKPRDNDVSYTANPAGSCVYATSGDAFTVWNTPIHLPNGSTIDTLRMYYNDLSTLNMIGWFTIYDLYGTIVQEWQVSSSGNTGNGFSDTSQINHTIDYSIYNYVINWRPVSAESALQLCGFRVFYQPPPYGLGFIPAVLND